MASKSTIYLTARDNEVLDALIKTPLDARQLLRMSRCFMQPFTHERLVRRRMTQLVTAGMASCYQYATFGAGAVNYYKPTKLGYQLAQGVKGNVPSRSFFGPVSMSLQEHTRAISDFIVKMHVDAFQQGIRVRGFYRENGLELHLGSRSLKPDCAFQLLDREGQSYNYLVEIDCGTEPVRSTKQRESLEQKIRFYDDYQDQSDKRFRVLMLFAQPSSRMEHFCNAAVQCVRNPNRTLFYSTTIPDFIHCDDALTEPIFLDRNQRLRSVVPSRRSAIKAATTNQHQLLASMTPIW